MLAHESPRTIDFSVYHPPEHLRRETGRLALVLFDTCNYEKEGVDIKAILLPMLHKLGVTLITAHEDPAWNNSRNASCTANEEYRNGVKHDLAELTTGQYDGLIIVGTSLTAFLALFLASVAQKDEPQHPRVVGIGALSTSFPHPDFDPSPDYYKNMYADPKNPDAFARVVGFVDDVRAGHITIPEETPMLVTRSGEDNETAYNALCEALTAAGHQVLQREYVRTRHQYPSWAWILEGELPNLIRLASNVLGKGTE